MDELQKLVPDFKGDIAFTNTNFGSSNPRDVIKDTLLKYASIYHSGSTATAICVELGLIVKGKSRYGYNLTKLGKEYLYEAFKDKANY